MSEKLGLDEIVNHEDSIYVGTLQEILRRCRKYLDVEEKRGWAGEMTRKLNNKYLDLKLEDNYIRNFSTRIENAEKDLKNPYRINLRRQILFTLQTVAEYTSEEIENFKNLVDTKYNPNEFTVAYSESNYKTIQLIRTFTAGKISRQQYDWLFESTDITIIQNHILTVEEHQMNGDKGKNWLRITYLQNEDIKTAFFSAIQNHKLEDNSKLHQFFLRFRKK